MFCEKCGAAMEEGDLFCPSCGEKMESAQPAPAGPGSEKPPKKKKSKGKKIVIIILSLLLLIGISAAAVYFLVLQGPGQTEEKKEKQQTEQIDNNEKEAEEKEEDFTDEINEAIQTAQDHVKEEEYEQAITVLNKAIKDYGEAEELVSLAEEYSDTYAKKVIAEADQLAGEEEYNQAISLVQSALKVVSFHEQLEEKLTALQELKPVALNTLKLSNEEKFEQEENDTKIDTVGNQYSAGNLFAFHKYSGASYGDYFLDGKYSTISGIVTISDNSSTGEDTANFEIYGDDVLLFSTENMSRTSSPVEFNVDISGIKWIKFQRNHVEGDGVEMLMANVMLKRN